MSPAQQRGLALWAVLLSAVVCLSFLPVSRWVSVLILLVVLGVSVSGTDKERVSWKIQPACYVV